MMYSVNSSSVLNRFGELRFEECDIRAYVRFREAIVNIVPSSVVLPAENQRMAVPTKEINELLTKGTL